MEGKNHAGCVLHCRLYLSLIHISEQGKFPVVPIVIAVVMIIGTVIGIVIYKKKKHKKSEEEEERLADEFDRLTEDEPREP